MTFSSEIWLRHASRPCQRYLMREKISSCRAASLQAAEHAKLKAESLRLARAELESERATLLLSKAEAQTAAMEAADRVIEQIEERPKPH